MPRRSNLSRRSNNAQRQSNNRANETAEQRANRIEHTRASMALHRSLLTTEQRQDMLQANRLRYQRVRADHSLEMNSNQRRRIRAANVNLFRCAFNYDCMINFKELPVVLIGQMNVVCPHCNALKFPLETNGLCCANGKVRLPELQPPPQPLYDLLYGLDAQLSNTFLKNIQKLNSSFQMTSLRANVIHESSGIYSFKVQGQLYHVYGALLPKPDENSSFLQIYFISDEGQQAERRCDIFNMREIERIIVREIQQMLHNVNVYVRTFKMNLDHMSDECKILIKADKRPAGAHARQYNAPTTDEIAVIIPNDNTVADKRDILLRRRYDGPPQNINETHRSYDALQYPLMFPRGEDGYHLQINMTDSITGQELNKKVSCMNYYAYRYMIRVGVDNHLLRYRRLFQQYAVDMFVKMETERLNYLRHNQAQLRSEEYIHLRDAMSTEGDATNVGRLTILPSSYVGSPRHMHEYAQDAMTYVRHYGRPDLFITFTCNPKWSEIKHQFSTGQICSDRHDITARVFKSKLRVLMDFIVKHQVYGSVRCHMYNIEWQKRGLPHAHILVWMVDRIMPADIDKIISAEIPDPVADPELYNTVKSNMIHGPCGVHNPRAPCMIDGKCSRRYPRPLVAETIHADDGYPLYRRRSLDDGGRTVTLDVNKNQMVVDNSWVVPYCALLSKTFDAHINVESCQSVKSIKYVCKYVTKGSDKAIFTVTNQNHEHNETFDEIKQYQDGRYVSCNEAIWRTFSFPIHERYPTVQHLAVHLENGQRVYFTEANAAQRAERPPSTTLTSFFETCRIDPFARTLKYFQMPRYFTWTSNTFQRRRRGEPVSGYPNVFATNALGRIYTVNPKQDECFYLRLLLVHVVGPTSFESLRTVNGHLCQTYREACQLMHLLQDDTHWDHTLAEAVITASPYQLRVLFAIIISTCRPSQPKTLWDNYKNNIAEDILHRVRIANGDMDIPMSDEILNEALIAIEDLCFTMTGNLLRSISMPSPNRSMHDAFNVELNREKQYDLNVLADIVQRNCPLLTPEQKTVYDTLIKAVDDRVGGVFFLDAPGGTGKTFIISLILANIRARSEIALALASSGVAATLLDGGRTAHSALKLPLNMRVIQTPSCGIGRGTAMSKVLLAARIIIWDECTMAHKGGFEALDRTLRDLKGNNELFGGVMILLSGDFRQTLPVVPRGTAADQISACLKSSSLWCKVKKLKLSQNMRVILQNDTTAAEFSAQLLKIGDGKQPRDSTTGLIEFPPNFCQFVNSKEGLISKVFPNIILNYINHDWLSRRAILAAKNKDVDEINFTIQSSIPGQLHSYHSVDEAAEPEQAANYPTEFLNSLDLPGLPPHNLRLKVGSVVIMLRNLNQPKLCNGTRLVIKELKPNVIQATILKGKFKGEDVMIPRIPLIPNDSPIEFKRIQFPLRLAFAMTINKAQGQSLGVCGLNLEAACFSHGQLYVACSRVGKPSNLYVYAPEHKTQNIVYHQALR